MFSTKTLGALAVGLLVSACGSSDSNGAAAAGTLGGDPGPCGGAAEKCCTSGTLCSAGLTCSDQYCLACGAAPASSMGCTNVATAGTATAATASGAMPDDPMKVIDNDVCTSWNYGDYGNANSFWQVDLGSAQMLDSLTLWPKMTPADGDVTFHLQYKVADSDAFTEYPSESGLTVTLHDYSPWQTTFTPAITARYFRVTIVNTPSFAALREVGLYTGCTQ